MLPLVWVSQAVNQGKLQLGGREDYDVTLRKVLNVEASVSSCSAVKQNKTVSRCTKETYPRP